MNFLLAILIVANQGAGSISFIDTNAAKVAKTVVAGVGPHEVAASPDGKRVAVTMYGRQTPNHEIAIVDAKSQEIVKRVDLSPSERAHGVTWRKGGVYVTLEREGAVARVNPDSGKVEWRAKTGGEVGHMLAVTRDEKKVYTGNIKSNDVSVIRVGEDAAYVKINVGAGPEGIALSPDDKEVWAAHRMGGGISIIDTAKDQVVATIADDVYSARVTFTPDGKKVLAYDMASRSIVIFDRAARKEIGRVTFEEGVPVSGLVVDAKHAYITRYQPDGLVELDLETLKLGRVIATEAMPDGMVIAK
ncbi:MAG TPA: YncE family protein [Thermoanaerobaculia bacterium]